MHRREFMERSLSMAGTLPIAMHAFAESGMQATPGNLHVLVDTRFAASRQFGEISAARGARISRYHGDLTQLWQRALLPQWRSGRGRMAGISTQRGWLCLSQLAGEHRWVAHAQPAQGSELVAWSLAPGVRS